MQSRCDLSELLSRLPIKEKNTIRGEADFYGASYLIAKKLKLPFIPFSTSNWTHGASMTKLKYKEQLTTQKEHSKCLVASKEQAEFLKDCLIDATATGLPFLYVKDVDELIIQRIPNSLLVMPPHSLPYTKHDWDEESYARKINELRSNFDLIVVCLFSNCINDGLWVKAFEKYNIPWIEGADPYDKHALLRIYRIFNSFEYMTTCAPGSHIVYASYCGCKVSIYGDYQEYCEEDYKDTPVYIKYPFLLKYNLASQSEIVFKKSYPWLFCSPKHAKNMQEWANKEIGKKNKKSALYMAYLLGWSPWNELFHLAYRGLHYIFRRIMINFFYKKIVLRFFKYFLSTN